MRRRTGARRALPRWLAAAVAAVLALGWWLAPSAVAGGPTSVLISSPESGETAALYSSDREYDELMRHLGASAAPSESASEPGGSQVSRPVEVNALTGPQLTVTWMIHDVSPWRVDRLRLGAKGSEGIWIETSSQLPTVQQGVWHKAGEPAALRTLLSKLGVMGERSGGSVGGEGYPAPFETADSTPAPGRAPDRATAHSPADDGWSPWWWAAGGLAAGLATGLIARPLASRLPRPPFGPGREPDDGPRQQTLDV